MKEKKALPLEQQLVERLTARKMTVTTVESCTGGLVAGRITNVPGSSAVFRQGYVTYCDEAKHELVGVKRRTLETYTAVSAQTAGEMAKGARKRAGADIAVSVTGYAGPASEGSHDEVGLVYIGCRVRGKTTVKEFHFTGDRGEVRAQAATEALRLLLECLPQG